jgi:glucokinase
MEKYLLGIDLGGTKLAIGLVKPDGTMVDEIITHEHVKKCCNDIVDDMEIFARVILKRHGLNEENILGIGVIFPGHIRSRDGMCITTSNLAAGFKDYPLKQKIVEKFPNIPVCVDNDANGQAIAEYKYGAGKGYKNMIFITISTGVGSGIILNGQLYRGMTGTAGELGHTIINAKSKRKCTCGNYGCLMTESCGMFLPDMAIEHLKAGVETAMGVTMDNAKVTVTGKSVKNGIDLKDPLALALMEESAEAIGVALYNLYQLHNPEIIVLGGGLINWGPSYIDKIRDNFKNKARGMLYDEMKIVTTLIGDDAGVLGAAALPMEDIAVCLT